MVVLILDISRDHIDEDLSLRDWLEGYRIHYLYILTKADKLSNNQAINRRLIIEKILHISAGVKPILFSAVTQKGKSEIWHALDAHLQSLTVK